MTSTFPTAPTPADLTNDLVHVRAEESVAVVTLQRADKFNAVSPELDQAVSHVLRSLGQDDSVRVVVLTGAGEKAFCTGADIPTYFPWLQQHMRESDAPLNFCGLTHANPLPGKPVIAAVNGLALGGGCELALASDLRIASVHAQFALPEPRWGVVAGAGGCTRILRALPQAVAGEVLLAGRRINADEALSWGLVSHVVAPEMLLPKALELGRRIAASSPQAIAGLVEFWRAQRLRDEAAPLEAERLLLRGLVTSGALEGVAAFQARR